jgi:hypothetical protein
MTDTETWKERRAQVTRYRVLEQETTEPLAALLLHDIVLELEADLKETQRDGVESNASMRRIPWRGPADDHEMEAVFPRQQ